VIGRLPASSRSGLQPGAKSFGSMVISRSSCSEPLSTRFSTASAIGNL
jgi:hypothetical protein